MKLSMIVPCYNEGENIEPMYRAIRGALQLTSISYEVIFVNDGSKDDTLEKLKDVYERHNKHIRIISFSRNFGKEAAIYAGLKAASGEYTTIIDADLQQRPELVLDMIKLLDEDTSIDMVAAYQDIRHEGMVLTFFKKCFYRLINRMSDVEFKEGASDFRTMRRYVVDAILDLPENYRFSKGIFSWVGFETYYMPYVVEQRAAGSSKWSFWKLFRYAMEGIMAFTTAPLRAATMAGGFVSLLAIVYMIVVVVQKIFFSIDIPGYPTLITVILLLGGIQLMVLGIMGEYLAKTYMQGKHRPIFIARERIGFMEEEDSNQDDKVDKKDVQ